MLDMFYCWLAKRLPRVLIYWCILHAISEVTGEDDNVNKHGAFDMAGIYMYGDDYEICLPSHEMINETDKD